MWDEVAVSVPHLRRKMLVVFGGGRGASFAFETIQSQKLGRKLKLCVLTTDHVLQNELENIPLEEEFVSHPLLVHAPGEETWADKIFVLQTDNNNTPAAGHDACLADPECPLGPRESPIAAAVSPGRFVAPVGGESKKSHADTHQHSLTRTTTSTGVTTRASSGMRPL